MTNNYIYYVEGQNEKKLVDVLKSEFQWIANGKVFVHNVLTRPIPRASLRQIKNNTIAIFLFDTDNERCGLDLLQVADAGIHLGGLAVADEVRDRNSGQNGDDGDHDHDFYEGKTLLHLLLHGCVPY